MTRATPFDFGYTGAFLDDRPHRQQHSTASGILASMPQAVAIPASKDDLAALVRWAHQQWSALIPRGAATGMPGGNIGSGIALDMVTGFRAPPRIDPTAARAWVEPGVTLAQLNEAAGEYGLHLPVDPSSADRCTLGGMIANNSAGAHSVKYGAMRPWVRTLDLVLDDGTSLTLERGGEMPEPLRSRLEPFLRQLWRAEPEIRNAWPKVRKNSSGYALKEFLDTSDALDLFIGSEGTLALITGAQIELTRRPLHTGLLLIEFSDLDAAVAGIEQILPLQPETCEYLDRTFLDLVRRAATPPAVPLPASLEAILLVEVSGNDPSETERALDELSDAIAPLALSTIRASDPQRVQALWELRHAASPIIAREAGSRVSMQFIEDSVVPIEALAVYVRGLRAILQKHALPAVIFGHAGDGNLHVNPLVDVSAPDWRALIATVLHEVAELVHSLGGTLAGEHGDGRLRAPLLEQIWGEPCFSLFRKLKDTLDPQGVLNPGTILPLPGQTPFDEVKSFG